MSRESMLEKEYQIHSDKYNVDGIVRDYGMVIKLFFVFQGRNVTIGMARPFQKDIAEEGIAFLESYIKHFAGEETKKTTLHYWYVKEIEEGVLIAKGIVTGHRKLPDASSIHTSPIQSISIDYENGEALIQTGKSLFHCPLAYCRFKKQDKYPEYVPDYEEIKAEYSGKIEDPTIEDGNVLLVLSNFDEYYFHSLYCKKADEDERKEYIGYPHVGTFQDSYLIQTEDGTIDIRYFPHFQNIEFYARQTDDMPLYIENIGSSVLYVQVGSMKLCLEPGDRKKVCKENSEEEKISLPDGDLYPAGIAQENPKEIWGPLSEKASSGDDEGEA